MLNWALSPLMREIVEAAERLGGGGRRADIVEEAARRGESGRHGAEAHFAQGFVELIDRGILRRDREATQMLWLTDEAWVERGHRGPPPRSSQMGLFG